MRTSDAVHDSSTRCWTLLLVRPFAEKKTQLPWPLLTSRSVSPRRPFRHKARSPQGKNALLHCTTAGFTPLRLDHKSFANHCPLTLLGSALYPALVHRLAVSLHASSPRSVALTQLRFASLTVVSPRRDLHPQECAHAGRTTRTAPTGAVEDGLQAAQRRRAFGYKSRLASLIWRFSSLRSSGVMRPRRPPSSRMESRIACSWRMRASSRISWARGS